jgi:predicted dienelactone hydrolase
MLLGFAVENLLKAAIVKRNPRQIFDETERIHALPKIFKTHDLIWLCCQAGIALTKKQTETVTRISGLVVWAGRYPIPLVPEPEGSGPWPPIAPTSHSRMHSTDDVDWVEEILGLISAQSGIKNPIDGGYE